MPNCSLLDSKNQDTETKTCQAAPLMSGKMEVMSDSSLDDMKFRNCQDDDAQAEVPFDPSLNGVNQQEVDTNKYDGCEENYTNGNSCENGVEAMDTDGNLMNEENYEQGNEDLSNNLAYDEEVSLNFPSCVTMEYAECSPQPPNGEDFYEESGNFAEQDAANKEMDEEAQNSNDQQDFASGMDGKDPTDETKTDNDDLEDKAAETDSIEKPMDEEEDKETECENEVSDENVAEAREEGGITDEGERREEKESEDPCEGVINLSTPTKSQGDDDSGADGTPDKSGKKKKSLPINVTPRRSSRNLNKTKNYTDEVVVKSDDDAQEAGGDDDRKMKKNTIVVSDTKKLVEIASVRKPNKTGKKEPTLVIIDTNSLLAAKRAASQSLSHGGTPHMTITPSPGPGFRRISLPSNSVFHHKSLKPTSITSVPAVPQQQSKTQQQPQVILPSLTDDMSVVEAPSFIAPYVYEKPPVNCLKDFLKELEKNIKKKGSEVKVKSEIKTEDSQPKEKEDEQKEDGETAKPEETGNEDVKKEEKAADAGDETKVEVKVEVKEEKDDESETCKDMEVDPEPKAEVKIKDDPEKESEKDDDSKDSSNKEEEKEKKEKTSDSDDTDVILVSETKKSGESEGSEEKSSKRSENYFDNPLGKFFMQIGINLVQEHVQIDLLRNQQRKRDREGKNCSPDVLMAISSLSRTLHSNKDKTESYKFELKKCHLCNFKTESQLVMAHHLEMPHMKNFLYHCNFCDKEVRNPHDILFHMESQHNVRGKLERTPAFHQCPNCPFEDNQKGKLSRHFLSCAKKFKPERNQEPSLEWEPPAKIPRIRGARGLPGSVVYPTSLAPRLITNTLGRSPSPTGVPRRGRPPIYGVRYPSDKTLTALRQGGVMFRPSLNSGQPPMLVPNPYQLSPAHLTSAQILQTKINSNATAKLLQQPSISITPLPRSSTGANPGTSGSSRPPSKATFVICEICDGYIKDLEQLRNHMQWIHKVKIHPKMIYSRPPLNCQKCQSRFFTDQGLERHLLGSHGLVTTSMQEASNRGKDGGRCPVCGRVFQWKLLNHVAVEHRMELKPAHLSYKCTVCTATFGMYKLFENHVYSAHSVVPKRSEKSKSQPSGSQESLLRPLKINDEITIIPQPARSKDKSLPPSKPPK